MGAIFGEVVRAERIRSRISLKEVSNRLGVSVAFLSMIEKGVKVVPDGMVDKLVAAIPTLLGRYDELVVLAYMSRSSISIPLSGRSFEDVKILLELCNGWSRLTEEHKRVISDMLKSVDL